MLGHKLWQTFAPRFDTYATLRRQPGDYSAAGIFDESHTVPGVAAENFETVRRALVSVRPDVVVNCVGIVKQLDAAHDPIPSITVNALFPHLLAVACGEIGARFIHLSTDCVFSGRDGNYSETDQPDATDLYGLSKLLGETTAPNCLTVRTSMIGRELEGSHGLLEWFLSNRGGSVRGFKHAIFSGFTTQALAEIIALIVGEHPQLSGLRHVSAEPINKFDLLSLINDAYKLDITLTPDENFRCDRSLDSSLFRRETDINIPSWEQMIAQLAADSTPYKQIRRGVHGS